MTAQITILNSSTQPDGSFYCTGVFWLVAPSNAITQFPSFVSQVSAISSTDLASLRAGTLIEQFFNSGLFASGTTQAEVQAALQTMYDNAQEVLDNLNPPVSGLVNTYFDGYNWYNLSNENSTIPTNNFNVPLTSITMPGVPSASDGRPNFLPTLFPTEVQLTIIGAGDDPVHGPGQGTSFTHQSSDGYLTQHTITWTYNDYTYLAGGQIGYLGAQMGDMVDYWIYAPGTNVTTVSGTGNVNMVQVITDGYILVPGANTNNSVNLSTATPVPNETNTGFWDWTEPTNGLGAGTIMPNPTQTGGYDLYSFTIPLTHPVTALPLCGNQMFDLIVPAIIPRKVLPQWLHQVIITNSGHAGLQIFWLLTIARTNNTTG